MLNWLIPTAHAQVDIQSAFGPAKYFFSIGNLVNVLLPNVLTVAGAIALVAVVITGIKTIQSAGDAEAEKTSHNKQAFTAAVIGLILIFGAWWIIKIVETVTGLSILTPNIP